MTSTAQSQELLEKPVKQLFSHYLVPAIGGTLVSSIYVIGDTIIIGKGIGTQAMAALNIVLPLFNLFFGTGMLFGVGGSILMAISRGRGKEQEGNSYFTMAFCLNAVVCAVMMVLLLNFLQPIVRRLGASDVTMPYILSYAPCIIWGMGFFFFSSFLQAFVRNDGAPKLSMIAVISGGVTNIILDCVFVFSFQMGMAGAALASVIGTILTVLILVTHFFSKKNNLRFYFKGFTVKKAGEIVKSGLASFIIEVSNGVVTVFFNLQLLRYIGDIGVSVYGIIANTIIVFYSLCNGANQAAQPIISTNFGAQKWKRIEEVKRLALIVCLGVCIIPVVIVLVAPNAFTYIYLKPDEQILSLAPHAVRIYFSMFFLTGFNLFVISCFQSTAKAGYALLLCLMRGCVLSVLFVYLLPIFFGVNGIWASVPVAEVITAGTGYVLMRREKK